MERMPWMRIASVVVLMGCASLNRSAEQPATNTISIEIQNDGDLDAVVYAYRVGQRYRMGLVTAHQTTTLTMPWSQTDNGQAILYVHRIGESDDHDFVSNMVQVSEGDRPILFLHPELAASSLAVYPQR
jgi:hypothetical protein